MIRALTHSDLVDALDYNSETGVFTWKSARSGTSVGGVAGRKNPPRYNQICIDGKQYLAHRLAWFYVNGTWPAGEIDHINRDKLDNRIKNLRDVTHQENEINKGPSVRNKSGVVGVHWCGHYEKWCASIRIDGKLRNIGYFKWKYDAIAARQEAEEKRNLTLKKC